MPRVDGADRFLAAATTLGVAGGVSALTVQGIAIEAGVSKALVLYHFDDKRALLRALAVRLAQDDSASLRAASEADDPFEAWVSLGREAEGAGCRALLSALLLEPAVAARTSSIRALRQEAATALAVAMLSAANLKPRVSESLLGLMLLHQLDGSSTTEDANAEDQDARQASLDAFALGLLALGE